MTSFGVLPSGKRICPRTSTWAEAPGAVSPARIMATAKASAQRIALVEFMDAPPCRAACSGRIATEELFPAEPVTLASLTSKLANGRAKKKGATWWPPPFACYRHSPGGKKLEVNAEHQLQNASAIVIGCVGILKGIRDAAEGRPGDIDEVNGGRRVVGEEEVDIVKGVQGFSADLEVHALGDVGLLGQAEVRPVEVRPGKEYALANLAGGAWRNKGRVGGTSASDQAGGEPKYFAGRLANAEHALELIGSDAIQDYTGIILIESAAIGDVIDDVPARKQEVPSGLQAMDGADLPAADDPVCETIGRGPMVARTEGELVDAVCLEDVAEVPRGRAFIVAWVAQRTERHKVHGTVAIVVGQGLREGVVSGQLEALREAAPYFNLQGIVSGLRAVIEAERTIQAACAAGIGVCDEEVRRVRADRRRRCRATDARESILPSEIAHESAGSREIVCKGASSAVVEERHKRGAGEIRVRSAPESGRR